MVGLWGWSRIPSKIPNRGWNSLFLWNQSGGWTTNFDVRSITSTPGPTPHRLCLYQHYMCLCGQICLLYHNKRTLSCVSGTVMQTTLSFIDLLHISTTSTQIITDEHLNLNYPYWFALISASKSKLHQLNGTEIYVVIDNLIIVT